MAAPTDYYIDPSTGDDDTGDGSSGSPWKTVEYALGPSGITRDTTNGDCINISHSATNVLGASLDITTNYGTPQIGKPLVFKGWINGSQGNGALLSGMGRISGSGAYAVIDNVALSNIEFYNMYLDNCGSNYVIRLDDYIRAEQTHFENDADQEVVIANLFAVFDNCSFVRNGTGAGLYTLNLGTTIMKNCYIKSAGGLYATQFIASSTVWLMNNIIHVTSTACGGINASSSHGVRIIGNTIYHSNSGTGDGINSLNRYRLMGMNNYVEGFIGSGGTGWNMSGKGYVFGKNKHYNNVTVIDPDIVINVGDTEELANSPLADPDNGDFSVDASVKAGAYPTSFMNIATGQFIDIGAVQREEISGRLTRLVGAGGGLVG